MKLIVGLGNVGFAYRLTRHNIGFMVVDALADSSWKKSEFSLIQKVQKNQVLLAKPQTQMNLSGQAVQHLMSYYKVDNQDLLVIHDDIDLDFLQMKFQKGRGHGGHNGVRNIHEQLGHSDYYRLRLGVGRGSSQQTLEQPMNSTDIVDETYRIHRIQRTTKASNYVLSQFSKEELPQLEAFLVRSVQAVEHFISDGGESAGNYFNQKNSP